ncbi:MAG TPA: FG-GAP-like repeat-containing protein [Terracidiphilus sp.]|nr:FG-GAP-like repeat-containing protein [Terracidiphilus sp.]
MFRLLFSSVAIASTMLLAVAASGLDGWGQTKTVTATTLTVTSGGSGVTSVASGSVVSLTASVSAGATQITTGQVNFCDASAKSCTDIHLLGTVQLTSEGTATVKFRPGIGSHSYKAVFAGTNTYLGSASAASALTVTGTIPALATATTIAETGSWGNYTVTGTVTEAGSKTPPTGEVSFLDTSNGNSLLGSGNLGTSVAGIGWPNPKSLANGGANAVQIADFNGDGIPDLLVATNQVTIYLGHADGTYTKAATPSIQGPSDSPVVIADFNGDGIPDLGVPMYSANYVSILLGNGDGTFGPVLQATVPGSIVMVSNMVTGDFNGDGIPDLAVLNDFQGPAFYILLGNGDGTFTVDATNPPISGYPSDFATGDFNGDGKTDLAEAEGDSIVILLGNGDGTFNNSGSVQTGSGGPIAVADFDGDGKLDLAVAAGGQGGTSESVIIFTGNGDGTFNPPTSIATNPATAVTWIQVADFNQDGTPDVVIADSAGSATVFLNNGIGSLSESFPVVSGLSVPYYLEVGVGDLNGDGYPDIAAGGYYNGSLGIYITEPTETATVSTSISLPAGPHHVDASYSGDPNYNTSVSGTLPMWGASAATTTGLTLTAGGTAVSSVAPGTVVTLTATVMVGANPLTAGQVNFCDATASHCTDIHIVGSASLTSNGTAAYKFIPGPGSHSYKAEFVMSGLGAASSSGAVSLTVGPSPAPVYSDAATISLAGYTGSYSLTATVTGYGGSAAPTGNVSFLDTSFGNTNLGTAALGAATAGVGWLVSQTPSLSSHPTIEIAGDFNNDGIPDLLLFFSSNYGGGGPFSWTILFGKGDGTFTTGPTTQAPELASEQNIYLIAGDFNGDGNTDLAVLGDSFSYSGNFVTTYLGHGDGTFGAGTTSTAYNVPGQGGDVILGSMVTGDFNGDGKLDLAIVGDYVNFGGVTVLLGNGDGTFTATGPNYAPTSGFNQVAAGDFNGDGILDLIATTYFSPGGATVFLGKGDGTFTVSPTQLPIGTFSKSLVVGDFNGDGILDVAFGSGGVYLGAGDGTFKEAPGNPDYPAGFNLVAGDFNHDGKADLAAFDNYMDQVNLFLGNGDGTFVLQPLGPVMGQGSGFGTPMVSADFNGDGVSDMAVILQNATSVAILLTEPTETATATVNHIAPVGAGNHNVEASYAGDGNYPSSTSGTVQLTAGLAPLVITPASGTYTTAQTISISESIPGATIYYSASGIVNRNGYVQYTGPIQLTEGGTEYIQAYATETGYWQSDYANATYTINMPAAPAPTFSPAAGTYAGPQTVTISDAVAGATIYYTTDGSIPTNSSAVYAGAISVPASETLVAVAIAPGYSVSNLASAQYLIASSQTPFIYTFAGNEAYGYSGDGGPATLADLNDPGPAVVDSAGNVYFSDEANNVIRMVAAGTGIITTVAGTGTPGYSGDGGAATLAQLNLPWALAIDTSGNLYVSDTQNYVIRRVDAKTGIISTYAGNGTSGTGGDGGPALSAGIAFTEAMAMDGSGNLYLADAGADTVREITASTGIITRIAGTGHFGYTGDGGPALNATFDYPYGIAVDATGNIYVADLYNNVIRKVDQSTGNISTVVGNGYGAGNYNGGFSGDGGPATSAELYWPRGIVLDTAGNLYISDEYNQRLRKVTASTGIITTIAGNASEFECFSTSGDGGPATSAALCFPYSVAVDKTGNLYLSDAYSRIRLVTFPAVPPATTAATPAISVAPGTYAGSQTVTVSDSTPGAEIYITMNGSAPQTTGQGYNGPINVTGNVTIGAIAAAPGYLPSAPASAAYTITTPPSLLIKTVAGSGTYGLSGQGGSAFNAQIGRVGGTAVDSAGNFYFCDTSWSVIWKVSANSGTISIVAGTAGYFGYQGDNGPATSAVLADPQGVAVDSAGNLYIADTQNDLIRKVTASTGIITTVAGTRQYVNGLGDGGPATSARLTLPSAVEVDASGNLYIADSDNNEVRFVSAATGIISAFAGNGAYGVASGDGGPATSAVVGYPAQLALDGAGNVYIATQNPTVVRKVTAATGIISTVAGNGARGGSGDGGPATTAQISPNGLAADATGNLYISNGNNVIRRVDAGTGIIARYAGNGYVGFSGDGGSATIASLCDPAGLAFDGSGNLFFADTCNYRIRELTSTANATPAPTFTPPAGTYSGSQTITIADSALNAAIYYTTDGSTPSTFSTPYSGAITVSASETLKAIAIAPDYTESSVSSAAYVITQLPAPTITWATPAAITYGTALSATQLDATASVPGTFSYAPSAGTVLNAGQQTLSVTFTPTDTASYAMATASVRLVVNQAESTITWATPAPITYGTALGSAQLDATASVPGTFVYSPAAGTALKAGQQTLSVTFTPNDATDYTTATASVTLVVNPATPAITWPTPAAITYGTALSATQLDATASVPGTFTYTPPAGTVLNAGQQTLSVTFTPADTASYASATATVTLVVNQATPTITWATPAPISFGAALGSAQLDATASVAGTFAYSPAAGTVPPVGNDTLSTTFTPTDSTDYTTATGTVTLVVNPSGPAIASMSPAIAIAGNAAFTLTVNGSGFAQSSLVYWGSTALGTQFVSATQLTAQVPASEFATAGIIAITVQTPAPGGGTSNTLQFEVDPAGSTPPTFGSSSVTVTAGSTATYTVTLPSGATDVSAKCLNLPTGAACTYTSGTLTITTSSSTPKGTYEITAVFTETLPGAAAAGIFLPFLLLPLYLLRRKFTRRGWITAAVVVIALTCASLWVTGCGGGGSSSPTPTPTPNPTHQAASSGVVTLIVQ